MLVKLKQLENYPGFGAMGMEGLQGHRNTHWL
jgi:type IV secretory pathway VirB10-like protein